jgi:hypothetical protein
MPQRYAVLSIWCVVLLYGMLVALQSGDRRWMDGARLWFPFLAIAAPPYLFMAWRLASRPDDRLGLGLAVVAGVVAPLLIFWFVLSMGRVKEQPALNLFVGLLFFNFTLLAALFLFVPLQIRLALGAWRTLHASSGLGAIVLGALVAGVYAALASSIAPGLMASAEHEDSRIAYSENTARRHLGRVYRCLWRLAGPGGVNGFPATDDALRSLGDECWDPTLAPGGTEYGTAYEFRYQPGRPDADGRIRSFGISTNRRSDRRSYTDSYYIDETGLLRHSKSGWATANTPLARNVDLEALPALLGLLDAYRIVHGRLPARLMPYRPYDNLSIGPNDLVIPSGVGPPVRELLAARDSATRLRLDSSVLEYLPTSIPAEGSEQTCILRIVRDQPTVSTARSYFVDREGRIHGTGELRDATADDPIASPGEFRLERRAQVRDEYLTKWRAGDGSSP